MIVLDQQGIEELITRLKRIHDISYLKYGFLRPVVHGNIMALQLVIGKTSLEELLNDKTDYYVDMLINGKARKELKAEEVIE